MTASGTPRVFSIPAGVPFLDTLARSLLEGSLIPGFHPKDDPLALSDVAIYVPTRRSARALRASFVELCGGRSTILPTIRPLGDLDEETDAFQPDAASALADLPPIGGLDRLLLLAPLVQQWKHRIPAHLAQLYGEEVVVPASAADAIWLARDLARLIDEVETEQADWGKLAGLVDADHAGWWQLTLEFLSIVTKEWPKALEAFGRSNPAAYRRETILAAARRLRAEPGTGPVIAAGSTGSMPATAEFLAAVARHPQGAVILPGLDGSLDERSWRLLGEDRPEPQIFGHPQFGLRKLLALIGIDRAEVAEIGRCDPALEARMRLVSAAMRPAETTDEWPRLVKDKADEEAFSQISLIEAAHEREEAAAIAMLLRHAVQRELKISALVTGDRDLARRVSAELRRFGIVADDSAGLPLASAVEAQLLQLVLEVGLRPGNPVTILSLLKHPLLRLGLPRALARSAADTVELVALRAGTGRPDAASLASQFDARLRALTADPRKPFWWRRHEAGYQRARALCARLEEALMPVARLRALEGVTVDEAAKASAQALENICRAEDGSLDGLYGREEGEALAGFLRSLVATETPLRIDPGEWPEILNALMATERVRPQIGAESRVVIWGPLEARLQSVDLMVVGSMNEGVWPRRADADRFMSRFMKAGMSLEPPERRIGLAAHDFYMALGASEVVLSRSARSGEAPAVASRWLQRLLTIAGPQAAAAMRERGNRYLKWARGMDDALLTSFAPRPQPTPPLSARPTSFSVTEIETLRRDPYAVYARRILALRPLDPILRDPGAQERGVLLHDILHRFTQSGIDPASTTARVDLVDLGRMAFSEAGLPEDVAAVWWPRFMAMVPQLLQWERKRAGEIARRFSEVATRPVAIGTTGATLTGRADRIDVLGSGMADILDFKTGLNPSRRQAHMLVSPQLALEAALLRKGGFADLGAREPSDLVYVRLKASGSVEPESILTFRNRTRPAADLAEEAWRRLEDLVNHFRKYESGYISRSLPFREGDVDGDYDHLARVLEWSAGAGEEES